MSFSPLNVLLIGGGGREHALAWKLKQSPQLDRLFAAPGNAGIASVAECVPLNAGDHDAVARFCKEQRIGLVVIGPEAPLVAGLADDLEAQGVKVFGPSREAARLEGSKGFTKDLCAAYQIPTAAYVRFADAAAAKAYVAGKPLPMVIKADGLAAGKGVTIAETEAQVHAAIDACFGGAFGRAGAEVVIEEFLNGEEASFFALVDGTHALPLATAQDHKRAFDGDQGPNTGGMGAYSPAPIMTDELCRRTMTEIIEPTVRAMQERGTPFKGVLYAGLMIEDGAPKLIEYNVRFGDPEAQVLMLRLQSDLLPALLAVAEGRLSGVELEWRDEVALCVVMAAKGYPGAYAKGSEIRGLDATASDPDVQIFHAGTKREGPRLLADGGRVLGVTARGGSVGEVRTRAYAAIDKIDWPEGFCRRDIGWRALKRAEIQLSDEAEDILRAIFAIGSDRSLGLGKRIRVPSPGPAELYALCNLLAARPSEEKLQLFLEQNVGFLTSLVGTADNADLAILFKPPVGTRYRADFCVLQAFQGGSVAHLIEIETSHERLFNQAGSPARRLATALHQIDNWRMWINRNPVHYARELVLLAQAVPLSGDQTPGAAGVRLTDAQKLKQVWSGFGGFEEPFFSYTIIIGRWSKLTDFEKERLISRNRHGESQTKIFTYEQIARLANFRLEQDEWHDENQDRKDSV